jgi:hypothetical protein
MLLDRSPEVFRERGVGWAKKEEIPSGSGSSGRNGDGVVNARDGPAGTGASGGKVEGEVAFEVFQATTEGTNAGLTKMFGEESGV